MYVQTGSSAPVVDTNSLPRFIASLTSPTNGNPVTSAQLDVPPPVGSSLELTNFFVLGRLFSAFEEYDTQALLDASRPPGTYTLHVNRTAGAQSLTRTLAASDWPPIPQILNLPALQNVDTNNDLVVEWNGFTGAGESDSISFSLLLGSTPVYSAPDPCVPIALDKTATSITVPKSVLQAGATYDASLNYGHTGTFDTNSIPDIPSFAVTSKHLSFVVVTSGGVVPPKSPTIGSLGLTGRGLQAGITGASPNQSIQVQESTNLQPGSWSPVPTLQVQADASGNANLVFPVDTSGSKFYRLVTP